MVALSSSGRPGAWWLVVWLLLAFNVSTDAQASLGGNTGEGSPEPTVVYVSQPGQLLQAIRPNSTVKHIVIVQHLDLRAQAFAGATPLKLPPAIRSIVGDCDDSDEVMLEAALPINLKDRQCVIDVGGPFLATANSTASGAAVQLWLSSLYVRLRIPTATARAEEAFVTISSDAQVWMTELTLQGAETGRAGVLLHKASLFASDCVFTNFAAGRGAAWALESRFDQLGTLGAFDGCSFINNTNLPGSTVNSALHVAGGAALLLDKCVFWGDALGLTAERPAELISDVSRAITLVNVRGENTTMTKSVTATMRMPFLTADDKAYMSIQTEQISAMYQTPRPQTAPLLPPPPPEPSAVPASEVAAVQQAPRAGRTQEGDGAQLAAVVGGAVGAVVLLSVAAAVLVMRRRRSPPPAPATPLGVEYAFSGSNSVGLFEAERKLSGALGSAPLSDRFNRDLHVISEAHDETCVLSPSSTSDLSLPIDTLGASLMRTHHLRSATSPLCGLDPQGLTMLALEATDEDAAARVPDEADASEPITAPAGGVGAGGGVLSLQRGSDQGAPARCLDEVEAALDALAASPAPFLGRFVIDVAQARRRSLSGVTLNVVEAHGGVEYCVKFTAQPALHAREAALFAAPHLRAVMPMTDALLSNTDGAMATHSGYVFPPCTVMRRGTTLGEWAAGEALVVPAVLAVLSRIALWLKQLHEAGYAHRNLKPSNVVWQPEQETWALVDFGCAAEIGKSADLAFTMAYSPPEVVAAAQAGERSMVVDAAVDIWALGVIGYELLTRGRAFPPGMSPLTIASQMAGRLTLPWKGRERAEKLRQLGPLWRVVTSCLVDEPLVRPSAETLLAAMSKVNVQAGALA